MPSRWTPGCSWRNVTPSSGGASSGCLAAAKHCCAFLMATSPPSYAEVSAAMDLPIGSIGPTRGRCLGRLRELVSDAGLVVVGTDAELQERGRT